MRAVLFLCVLTTILVSACSTLPPMTQEEEEANRREMRLLRLNREWRDFDRR